MKSLIAFAVAATALPVLAQPSAAVAPPPTASPAAAIDPARLAVARQTVDYVWPLGTYQRLMSGATMDGIMQSVFSMKLADIVPPGAAPKNMDPKEANATLGETIANGDPYFQERMRVASRVITVELVPVLAKIEPDLRDGLAHAYARRFTVDQLTEMNRFFATPAGRAYASESMLIMMDPDVIRNMIKAGPALAQAMPQILAKLGEAEKQLPPRPHNPHPVAPPAGSH